MSFLTTYQVIALDAKGVSSIWHVPALNEREAKSMVTDAVVEQTQAKPAVVLAVIPGGKK